ncbi:ABC-F family ATP-binding cassette domain-containing protein [Aeribacillus pallidus]|uniref:ABC-F family ATP-binding cassette domain-containing protein n=1 Tax=Aeribacillus pallidus TaxID=33936 RepID=UPI003D1BF750
MILLQVNQLSKYFGADLIFSNVKLEIQSKDRIALVGRNGAGKSTLLKIIAGHLSYDAGEIVKPKDVTIGYLAQHTGLESELSIWDEMMTVFSHIKEMEQELRRMEQKMADPSIYENETAYQKLLKEYDQLQVRFKDAGGYQIEADIRSVLHGLNFHQYDYNTSIATLSGGQKTRLALGKLLLTKPDILILDEPTNHLDIETLSWLEQYLQNYSGAILIVSHDRYFLDKVVNRVYEISRHQIYKYEGNYSQYLIQRAEKYEQEKKQYEKQQDEIARLQDFIQRNIARASTTKRAQSRRKKLEKMTLLEKPHLDDGAASFSFDIERQSGNEVLKLSNVTIGYDDKALSTSINGRITRQESIALVGPNGVGKSTLLKTVVQKLAPLQGDITFGANVTIGYYDQEQADLHSNKTVLNELWDDYPTMTEKDIRTVLGNFLFSGDDVLKPVSSLSGGEKARLALAKLMLKKANFLVLDEPTNHLDLDSKEVLELALLNYPGTILFVSHDRYFINRLATKVWELSSEGIEEYLGDYDYYLEKKQELEELASIDTSSMKVETQKSTRSYEQEKEAKRQERQRQRRIEEIEKEINLLEEKIALKEEELCQPEVYQNHEKSACINKEIEEMKAKVDELMNEWTVLAE